jgi:hypothetical protein
MLYGLFIKGLTHKKVRIKQVYITVVNSSKFCYRL